MKLIDVGQEATGFIAIGQVATGFFALGQGAHGVIAVGQLAIGVVAVGQASVGVITVGMGSLGVMHCVAMMGLGGRGMGVVVPLVPSLGGREGPDEVVTVADVREGGQPGWVAAELVAGKRPQLLDGGAPVEARFDAALREAILEAPERSAVYARLVPGDSGLVVDRLTRRRPPRLLTPAWWMVWAGQLVGLLVLSALVWGLALQPLAAGLLRWDLRSFF